MLQIAVKYHYLKAQDFIKIEVYLPESLSQYYGYLLSLAMCQAWYWVCYSSDLIVRFYYHPLQMSWVLRGGSAP